MFSNMDLIIISPIPITIATGTINIIRVVSIEYLRNALISSSVNILSPPLKEMNTTRQDL